MSDQHLIDLEIKISHQEIAIEELRETVFKQQVMIDKLEKSLEIMNDRLKGVADGGFEIGPGNDKPPHY